MVANRGSISAITIIRIRVLTTVDFLDLPYSMIWAAFWSVTEPALANLNACVPMLRPIFKAAFPTLFASRKIYSTQPESGGSGDKNKAFRRMNDVDSDLQLTNLAQLEEPVGTSREVRSVHGDDGSQDDRLQDGRSHDESTHVPRSVIGTKPWA
jgi:hypothetical protein